MAGGSIPHHHVPVNPMGLTREQKARFFLFLACLWPLFVLALFGASSAGSNARVGESNGGGEVMEPGAIVHKKVQWRNILDRADVMGYGPTHPRVAFVVVGEEADLIRSSVESVFRNTDLNRVFLICAMVDGQSDNPELVEDLIKMDNGNVPHWHGLRADINFGGKEKDDSSKNDEDAHGRKVHTIFQPEKLGVSASRIEGAEFIQLLEQKYTDAGLKSPDEDLILVLLQAGAQLTDRQWLPAVTNALIVPPPILRDGEEDVALKLANAVSLRVEPPGKVTSFNEKFGAITNQEAKATDINLSSGESYSTPMFNGGGIALRLNTFLSLPAMDPSVMDPWAANLELALNLWLCADGIDIVHEAEITGLDVSFPSNKDPLDPDVAARFAAVWMEESFQPRFFQAYSKEITRLDWETKVQQAKRAETFPKNEVHKRCRSFEWYAQEVNPNIGAILDEKGWGKQEEAAKKGAIKKEDMGDSVVVEEKKAEPPAPPAAAEVKKEDKLSKVGEAEAKEEAHAQPPPLAEEEGGEKAKAQPIVEDPIRPKPKIPLRKENLEIVQKATPIDISYLSIDGGHKEHPHMGAKDEEGNYGYRHDETALRKNPPPLTWEKGEEKESCMRRDNNFRMMVERVVVDTDYEAKQNEAGVKRDKIFCLVYTIEAGHPKIPAIRETWGPKCDGFMVGSTRTNRTLGTVEIVHEGEEAYDNIWQKVRSMWSYIYDYYYEDYDWFHIGGDDLFLIVENLRKYLESEEIRTASNGGIFLPTGDETKQTPLLLGRRFAYQGDRNNIFDSGGSGYTMNKAAFKLLVTEGFPNYFPHAHTFSEDTMVSKIFKKMGVLPYDTKDGNGSERYMPFLPGHHWGYKVPKDINSDWYAKYSIDIKEGPEHCAINSVAFHYVKDRMMKRLFALAYGLCSAEYMKI